VFVSFVVGVLSRSGVPRALRSGGIPANTRAVPSAPAPPPEPVVPRVVDAAGLEAWFRRLGPMVHRRCAQVVRSDAEADDATQEVFVRVLQRARAHGGLVDDKPVSYLWQTATHVCLNRLRSRRRHPEDPVELLDEVAAVDDALGSSGMRRALERLLGREPASTRTMAVLHFVDGLTLEETALEMGLSVSGVRKRLRVLKQKLQHAPEREELR
jgi:RNA polymerase sigma-70 factor (ECF subfamily)